LVTISIQDLRPNPQDASAFYLENIYQLVADRNVSDAFTPVPIAKLPAFSPPGYAIWVNSLWFLSLAISLSCALLATLLHQWAHRYIRVTQPLRSGPRKRARIRAFFANGVDTLQAPWAVEAIPILLHLSLFTFLSGLLVFLFNINETTFTAILAWVAFSVGVYACITLIPIFRYDSPYYTPLSSTVWTLYAGALFVIFKVLSLIPGSRDTPQPFHDRKDRYREWVWGGVEKAAEDIAADRLSEVDGRVMEYTIDTLGDDDALERFFAAIPGFCNSNEVQLRLPSRLRMKIRHAMDGFLDRTLTSESVPDSIKIRRLSICLNAAHAALGSFVVSRILGNIFDGRWREVPRSLEMGHSLRPWCNSTDEWIALTARSIVASIIAVQERDDHWIALVKDQFGIPERVLRDNLRHGDSVLLLILLHVTRNLFDSVVPPWDSNILRVLSQFEIHNTRPELQHDFCALWNEIVREARNQRPYSRPVFILREIRHLYNALHDGTNSPSTGFSVPTARADDNVWQPSSYPLCHVASHLLDPILHVHGVIPGQSPPASPTIFHAVPHPYPALAPASLRPRRDGPPSPVLGRRRSNPIAAGPSFGDASDARQSFIPHAMSPQLDNQALSTTSLDVPAARSTQSVADTSAVLYVARPTPRPIPSDGPASPVSGETAIDPPAAPDTTPPPVSSSAAIPAEDPSAVASLPSQSEAPGSSSSAPSPLLLSPTADPHDTRDLDSPNPMEATRHPPHQSSSADTADTPRSEDVQQGSDQP